MIPATTQRVTQSTAPAVNRQIDQTTQANVDHFARGGREAITARLQELEQEWDIERTLEANAATACMVGVALGTFMDRRFYFLPAVVGGFLLMHAVQGWCPPLPIFRRMGVRTQSEIDREKYALKALRGDFRDVHPPIDGDGEFEVRHALKAAS